MARRRDKLALSKRNGGSGGRDFQFCNVPSHMGPRINNRKNETDSLDLEQESADVRLDRLLQDEQSARLGRRRAAAIALAIATLYVATRALPRSRTLPRFRVAKRAPRPAQMVGIPLSRTATRGRARPRAQKGGAFRFPRIPLIQRRRFRRRRLTAYMTAIAAERDAQFITEEGL